MIKKLNQTAQWHAQVLLSCIVENRVDTLETWCFSWEIRVEVWMRHEPRHVQD